MYSVRGVCGVVLVNGKCNWRKKPKLRASAAAAKRTFTVSSPPPVRHRETKLFVTFMCVANVMRRVIWGKASSNLYRSLSTLQWDPLERSTFVKIKRKIAMFGCLRWRTVVPFFSLFPAIQFSPSPIRSGCQIIMTSTNPQQRLCVPLQPL